MRLLYNYGFNLYPIVSYIFYDLMSDESEDAKESLEASNLKKYKTLRNKTIGSVVISIPLVITGMFLMDLPYANYIMWALATPVIMLFGQQFFAGAYIQAKHGSANMDTLVALSTGYRLSF